MNSEIIKQWSESDLPAGITINPIYHCKLRDINTDIEAEGTGWSEDEAYEDALDKLEDAVREHEEKG